MKVNTMELVCSWPEGNPPVTEVITPDPCLPLALCGLARQRGLIAQCYPTAPTPDENDSLSNLPQWCAHIEATRLRVEPLLRAARLQTDETDRTEEYYEAQQDKGDALPRLYAKNTFQLTLLQRHIMPLTDLTGYRDALTWSDNSRGTTETAIALLAEIVDDATAKRYGPSLAAGILSKLPPRWTMTREQLKQHLETVQAWADRDKPMMRLPVAPGFALVTR